MGSKIINNDTPVAQFRTIFDGSFPERFTGRHHLSRQWARARVGFNPSDMETLARFTFRHDLGYFPPHRAFPRPCLASGEISLKPADPRTGGGEDF